ncbi:phosphotransferase enzyme family-domain-containing protein [Nemania sp. FL0916]|nr:phosphotransferase enzyme family-domain-containing protein [Nemania sp. FL0916]
MASVSHNHANYQGRLAFIQQLLVDLLGLSDKDLEQPEVTPIQYDPECPFKYNNFVYRLKVPVPISSDRSGGKGHRLKQPGCVPIPPGTKEFILRLNNPDAEGMHAATRIENEVAIISLSSSALRHLEPNVVSRVFGWESAASSQGWILQEFMPGVPVDEAFKSMSLVQKRNILAQMAALLKDLQSFPLPESLTGWGGATFDASGRIVSAAMTSVGCGPWSSFEDSFRGRLQAALKKADEDPHVKGWHENNVRRRLEAFLERGLSAHFTSLVSRQDRSIIHADFTTNNLLFDPDSGRITALLDYDFASILHPLYEFLRSFDGVGGQFRGWSGDDESNEDLALRSAKLYGFPSPLPAVKDDGIQWDVAKAWEDELEKRDVKRPSNIQGIDKVADVDAVLRAVLPWHLTNRDFLQMQPDGAVEFFRNRGEEQLVKLLSHLGF